MTWVVLVLGLLCIAMSCVALWYREEWWQSEALSKHRLEMWKSCRDDNDALLEKICRMELHHKDEIYHLNIQLENERFNKGIFEQRWKNSEEELLKLRDKLPKRDSKGRYCKRK